jgi:hypothetical protein
MYSSRLSVSTLTSAWPSLCPTCATVEQGSQHGSEPLRAIGQYGANVSPRKERAQDDVSEDWMTTNSLNASSNYGPLDESDTEAQGPPDSGGPEQARRGHSSSAGQSLLSHSDNARPSRESRDTRTSTAKRSKSAKRSSGSRPSRGSWGSNPSSPRRPSSDEPTALGDLVEYSLGDDEGLREETYLTEQVALAKQRSPVRQPQYPQVNYSPSRPAVEQPSVRSPSHRQEVQDTRPSEQPSRSYSYQQEVQDKRPWEQRASQEQWTPVPEPAGAAAPAQQATPVTPAGNVTPVDNVSAPADEAKAATETLRPRRRRKLTPLRVMSADEGLAVAVGGGGGEGDLGNERKSDGDVQASSSRRQGHQSKSRRQRVRELDRAYHRDAPMAGRDSAASEASNTDVEDEEGWWGPSSEAGGLLEARVTSHRKRRNKE